MQDSAPKDSLRKDTTRKEFFFREGSRYSEAELERIVQLIESIG